MKTMNAILFGVGIWILGILAFTISSSISVLSDPELQGNLALAIALIPIVSLGSKLYFKKYKQANPFLVGLLFFATVFALDAMITVPVLMKPYGVSHADFFLAIPFWLIALEFYAIVIITKKLTIKS
jgi:hypothetical protein